MSNEALNTKGIGDIRTLYDEQAESFAVQAPGLLWWEFVGKPALTTIWVNFTKERTSKQVEIARQRIPQATFIVGDIRNVELPPDHFDLATSNMVLEFLDPDGLRQAMANTYGALKPGGVFFYITTHPEKMQRDSGLQEPGMFEATFPWGEKGPNYYRTLDDFLKATKGASFKIDQFEELGIPPEAERRDPQEYKRYAAYNHIRLVMKASKPT